MKSLCLPATLDALEAIGNFVMEVATEAGLDIKAAYNLRLAVDEIATNIITHGYEEAGLTGDVNASSMLSDTALTIVLKDTGIPFDPLNHKLPDEDELALPLEERGVGGLGILLVLKGVDKFNYEYQDGRNHNIFVMNRPCSLPA